MRILQVHNQYRQRGGEDGVVDAEAALLRTRGHEVAQMLTANPGSAIGATSALAAAAWNPRSAAKVAERIRVEDPDVVHLHNTWFALTGSAIAAAARIRPTFVTLHNYRLACVNAQFFRDGRVCTDCLGGGVGPGVRHGCYRGSRLTSAAAGVALLTIRRSAVLEQPRVTVLVHTPFAREVVEKTGITARVEQHDNFVDDPGPRRLEAHRSREVLMVARMSYEKGPDLALGAWRSLTGSGLRLTIVGDGPEHQRVLQRAAETSDIAVVGREPAEEVRRRMLQSRCLLVPSRWFESQPLVILEALAAGLPVIATDWPPIRSILHGMPPGALVELPTWNDGALTPLTDDEWIAASSTAGRALYEQRFNPDVAYERLMRLYSSPSSAV